MVPILRTALLAAFVALGLPAFAAPTVDVTHAYGTVHVPLKPTRVVVFSYDILDTLDALGVPVVGLPKSNLPASLARYKSSRYQDLGTLFEPDFEKVYALKPEVIFISTRQAKLYPEFAKIAPTVYLAAEPENFGPSVKAFNTTLARIFGLEAQVESRLQAFEAEAVSVSQAATKAGRKALVLMVNDKALSVFGPGSRFGMLHSGFGFAPADPTIAASTHGQSATFEYLRDKNPDVLFVLDRSAAIGGAGTAASVLDNPVVKGMDAAKNGRIVYLDPAAWYLTTGGLNAAVQMAADARQGLK